MKKNQIVKSISVSCLLMLPLACSPKTNNGGYMTDVPIKDEVVVGQTTKEQALAKLGSPSTQSSFGVETWYYITNRKETYAFFKPEVVLQDVTSIEFDNAGMVSKVGHYTKKDGENIALAKRTTPTEGHTLGFFEQILGNIGRFNGPSNDTAAPGRKPNS